MDKIGAASERRPSPSGVTQTQVKSHETMKPIEPPPGRQVFAQALAPSPADIDENGHVNNGVYVRWVQEMATAHWRSRAPEAAQACWTWVVLRHEIDYRRPLLPGENARARTWVGTRSGARFIRFVRIDGPDGEVCAQAVSEWCLINIHTRRPARIPDALAETFS
jgi:acyl-CoA thioester hydrolase